MKSACFVVAILLAFMAKGQQLNFSRFSYAQGLNTYNIEKVIQDRYGFLWVATQDGVYRFNGARFEAFRKSGNSLGKLLENFIFDIYYPGNDELFVATFRGGIDKINVRTLQVSHYTTG